VLGHSPIAIEFEADVAASRLGSDDTMEVIDNVPDLALAG
jgi:hypothetical protein